MNASKPALRWSWKIVTIAGIDIYVHGTFLLLIAFVAISDMVARQGAGAMMRNTVLVLAIFATVVLHELGHAFMARRFGVRTRDITLLPIGGVARLEKMPDKPRHQLLVALAGPAVNAAIALLLFGVLRALALPIGSAFEAGGAFLAQLMWINVSLAAFNLLPGYPMDGGRILRALLAMRMAPERATQLAARVGQGTAVIFGLVGAFVSPLLLIIGVLVWLGARAEHSMSKMKVALSGLSVRQAMVTDFRTVSATDPLSFAVTLTLTGFQRDFPVMDGERPIGVLTHGDLLKGLAESGTSVAVRQAMREERGTTSPSEKLDGAVARMHQGGSDAMVVVDNDAVVGLLTLGNIAELLALQAAGDHAKASRSGQLVPRSN